MSCPLCENDEKKLYAMSAYGEFYFDTFGEKKVLLAHINKCPQFAKCSAKEMDVYVALQLNYCPECGRRLKDERKKS